MATLSSVSANAIIYDYNYVAATIALAPTPSSLSLYDINIYANKFGKPFTEKTQTELVY